MIFLIGFLLYHTSLLYGMSHFQCDLISPQYVLILNGLSKSSMFDTYFGLQKTMSVDSLSNSISSFIFIACANKQCNTDHPITGYSLFLGKLIPLVILLSSLFDCTCYLASFITHSYFGILSLVMQSGDFCPDFRNSSTFLSFVQTIMEWYL